MARVAVPVIAAQWNDDEGWMAFCETGDCRWHSAFHVVKAGAQEEARWHRSKHRQNGERS